MNEKEIIMKVMALLRRGLIDRSTPNGEVFKMVLQDESDCTTHDAKKKKLERIAEVLDWYEGTDGCEREQPSFEMYVILTDIYSKEIQKYGKSNQNQR